MVILLEFCLSFPNFDIQASTSRWQKNSNGLTRHCCCSVWYKDIRFYTEYTYLIPLSPLCLEVLSSLKVFVVACWSFLFSWLRQRKALLFGSAVADFPFSKLFVSRCRYRSFTNRIQNSKELLSAILSKLCELLFFLSASALEKPQDLEGKSALALSWAC